MVEIIFLNPTLFALLLPSPNSLKVRMTPESGSKRKNSEAIGDSDLRPAKTNLVSSFGVPVPLVNSF